MPANDSQNRLDPFNYQENQRIFTLRENHANFAIASRICSTGASLPTPS